MRVKGACPVRLDPNTVCVIYELDLECIGSVALFRVVASKFGSMPSVSVPVIKIHQLSHLVWQDLITGN